MHKSRSILLDLISFWSMFSLKLLLRWVWRWNRMKLSSAMPILKIIWLSSKKSSMQNVKFPKVRAHHTKSKKILLAIADLLLILEAMTWKTRMINFWLSNPNWGTMLQSFGTRKSRLNDVYRYLYYIITTTVYNESTHWWRFKQIRQKSNQKFSLRAWSRLIDLSTSSCPLLKILVLLLLLPDVHLFGLWLVIVTL